MSTTYSLLDVDFLKDYEDVEELAGGGFDHGWHQPGD